MCVRRVCVCVYIVDGFRKWFIAFHGLAYERYTCGRSLEMVVHFFFGLYPCGFLALWHSGCATVTTTIVVVCKSPLLTHCYLLWPLHPFAARSVYRRYVRGHFNVIKLFSESYKSCRMWMDLVKTVFRPYLYGF